MAAESDPHADDQPEQIFARTIRVLIAVWLVLGLVTLAALDVMGTKVTRAGELADSGAGLRLAVRQVSSAFGALAETPGGEERQAALLSTRWEIERLLDLEARRAELGAASLPGSDRIGHAARDAMALLEPGPGTALARAQRDLFATRLGPLAERLALHDELHATERRRAARLITFGLFGLQLAAFGGVVLGIVLPARRRLAIWVADSLEAGREDRFRMLHDPLTRMPNALYLHAQIGRLAAASERAQNQTAVLRIDLDRFKSLRETLGARITDEIIRITARRIRQCLRVGDFAAHIGQDDFVVIAADLEDANSVAQIAQRIQAALSMPFSLRTGARRLSCSIGVTLVSDDEPEPDRILGNAEIALLEAQDAGSGNIRYFRKSLRAEAEQRETFYAEMVSGMARGELVPFFQPQIDLATGAVAGFEALVRWRHPTRGLLAPGSFLEFAEAADLTERIGEIVLSQAIAALNAWDAAGLHVPKIGVNFALGQLRDPRLVEKIKWEVERNDVQPERIAVEVLETVLIKSDADLVVRNLRGLASAGFQIDLDDFGTGHASIQNLRRFMVNRIKIDRSFVFGIETSEESRALTGSMIAMAKALGIRILAEGVETEAARDVLCRLGCDLAQGYLIAKPMPLADTFAWLAAHRPRAASAAAGDPNTA